MEFPTKLETSYDWYLFTRELYRRINEDEVIITKQQNKINALERDIIEWKAYLPDH